MVQFFSKLSVEYGTIIHVFCQNLTFVFQDAPENSFIFTFNNIITICQVFDSCVRSLNCALLAIAEMPNNELTSIHTLNLPPLHL